MTTVLLVIHLLLAIAMIGTVLLQKSEGGGLGIGGGGGGGGGGMGGFLTGRGTANLLTRTTAILAACFMVTSLTLTLLAGSGREADSILDAPIQGDVAPAAPGDSAPAEPEGPSVPVQ
ncbi:MAG: preprotein translocase subunit SecG [Kiloniellales bacterium]|nr:preprotein translocase subunit SecG [Kiloniellales bacterium]